MAADGGERGSGLDAEERLAVGAFGEAEEAVHPGEADDHAALRHGTGRDTGARALDGDGLAAGAGEA
ncbi:MAG: hypothetical protein BWZ09_00920 [Alphaproteobacteria bacterium ADurb.BinA305]|nr:MAG: hypothetical protein BWZ09_00920 [Alphaproteobacteria bacterium ADurb.BinA305]